MKKLLLFCAATMAMALTASAETYLAETFDYVEGNLYGNGKWVKYGKKTTAPIQVAKSPLTFAGYQDNAAGKAVRLTKESGEYCQMLFRDKGTDAAKGTVYYSALVNVSELPSGSRTAAFMALTGANSLDATKFGDAEAGSEGAGLFAQASGEGFKLGVSRNVANLGNVKTSVAWADKECAIGETYLVVVKYEIIDGADNDRISLWVNPAKGDAEPAASVVAEEECSESLADVRGIELRQGSSSVAKTPVAVIDEVRVASTWNEIFTPAKADAEETPEITITDMSVNFGKVYKGLTYTKTIKVKGKNLKGDISLSSPVSGEVTVSATTVAKADAESENGCDVVLTLTVDNTAMTSDKIVYAADGAQSRTQIVEWRPIETIAVNSFKELFDEDNISMNTLYIYKGEATVTAIDSNFYTFYAQDSQSAAEVRSASGCGYDEVDLTKVKPGDNITDIVGNVIFSDDGGIDFVPVAADAWRVVSEGNLVEPKVLTFEQIHAAEACDVIFQLVTVKDVKFDEKYGNYPDPDYYGKFNVPFHLVSDKTRSGELWYFRGTDIYNSSTKGYFDKVWTVTGICYYITPVATVAPRSLADFVVQPEGAVDSIAADGAEVVGYFDFYGRKVENPEPGIYVVRRADGTTGKAVVR
ncbi:MAG: hypothetical protein KH068_04665 [Prevotella sp.]|nr:hypothetical protein [Prevotella sp.]MBS7207668.1 hypothetical protein [Prevotella sp.]